MPDFHATKLIELIAKGLLAKNGKATGSSPQENLELVRQDPALNQEFNKLMLKLNKIDGQTASQEFLRRIRDAEEEPENKKNLIRDAGYDPNELAIKAAVDLDAIANDTATIMEYVIRMELKRQQEEAELLAQEKNNLHRSPHLILPKPKPIPTPPEPPAPTPNADSSRPTLSFTSHTLSALELDAVKNRFSEIMTDPSKATEFSVKVVPHPQNPNEFAIISKNNEGKEVISTLRHSYDPNTKLANIQLENPTDQSIQFMAQACGDLKSFGLMKMAPTGKAEVALQVGAMFIQAGMGKSLDLHPTDLATINDNKNQLKDNDHFKIFDKKGPTYLPTKLELNIPPAGT
jgi:hypothetical protein